MDYSGVTVSILEQQWRNDPIETGETGCGIEYCTETRYREL